MGEVATLKAKFRKSVVWREFRKHKSIEQNGKDPITGRKLLSKAHCHHIIQTSDLDVYRDLSDPSKFIMVNSSTHDAIHWALSLVKHDGMEAWKRYINEVEREVEMNNG